MSSKDGNGDKFVESTKHRRGDTFPPGKRVPAFKVYASPLETVESLGRASDPVRRAALRVRDARQQIEQRSLDFRVVHAASDEPPGSSDEATFAKCSPS